MTGFLGGAPAGKSRPDPADAMVSSLQGLEQVAQLTSPVTVLFVHYHHRGLVTPGFMRLVESAAESGYRCLFVSTRLSSASEEMLGRLNVAILKRGNYGYDFGSLKEARDVLVRHGLMGCSRYVVVNSSMLNICSEGFGKDAFLDELVSPTRSADLIGITSSFEDRVFHIQTYFFSMSSRLFESKAFGRFLGDYVRGLKSTKDSPRLYAIKNGELKLTRFAITQGLSVESILFDGGLPDRDSYRVMQELTTKLAEELCGTGSPPTGKLARVIDDFSSEWLPSSALQFNPSQSCWALLIARGFLFLKREVLELSDTRSIHAPSVCSTIVPLLKILGQELPPWSDLHRLPEILFAPKS